MKSIPPLESSAGDDVGRQAAKEVASLSKPSSNEGRLLKPSPKAQIEAAKAAWKACDEWYRSDSEEIIADYVADKIRDLILRRALASGGGEKGAASSIRSALLSDEAIGDAEYAARFAFADGVDRPAVLRAIITAALDKARL